MTAVGTSKVPYRCQCRRVRSHVAPLAVLVRRHGQLRPRHGRQQVHERGAQHGARDRVRPPAGRNVGGSGLFYHESEQQHDPVGP